MPANVLDDPEYDLPPEGIEDRRGEPPYTPPEGADRGSAANDEWVSKTRPLYTDKGDLADKAGYNDLQMQRGVVARNEKGDYVDPTGAYKAYDTTNMDPETKNAVDSVLKYQRDAAGLGGKESGEVGTDNESVEGAGQQSGLAYAGGGTVKRYQDAGPVTSEDDPYIAPGESTPSPQPYVSPDEVSQEGEPAGLPEQADEATGGFGELGTSRIGRRLREIFQNFVTPEAGPTDTGGAAGFQADQPSPAEKAARGAPARSLEEYIRGTHAADPNQVHAAETLMDTSGQANPNQIRPLTLKAVRDAVGLPAADAVMNTWRQQNNAGRGIAAAAATHGDWESAAKALSFAHDAIPDGEDVNYRVVYDNPAQPTQATGMVAEVGGKQIPLTLEQFNALAHTRVGQFDHIYEQGALDSLQKLSLTPGLPVQQAPAPQVGVNPEAQGPANTPWDTRPGPGMAAAGFTENIPQGYQKVGPQTVTYNPEGTSTPNQPATPPAAPAQWTRSGNVLTRVQPEAAPPPAAAEGARQPQPPRGTISPTREEQNAERLRLQQNAEQRKAANARAKNFRPASNPALKIAQAQAAGAQPVWMGQPAYKGKDGKWYVKSRR